MITSRFWLIVFLFAGIPVAFCQTKEYTSEFGFRSDNDSYLAVGQDRYYTNGLQIFYRHATDQSGLSKRVNKLIWELEAGQQMYNAQSGNIPDISLVDRPFAAYLYGGAGVNLLYQNESALKISAQFGTIGPDARGKEAQESLHDLVGFYEIDGWQWQVNNELALNTALKYTRLAYRSTSGKFDLSGHTALNIGNTFTGAGIGALIRLGNLRPLYHSASTESAISNNDRMMASSEKELFFFARPLLHYVVYDATIEGGMFRDDKGLVTFGAKPLVFSQQIGGSYSKGRWMAEFSVIFKTKEVKSFARPHQYGSALLAYRFN